MSRQIFINGRFLTQPLTGVQRYSHELLRAFDEINPNVELICLAPPEKFSHPQWKNITLKVIGRNRGNLWEQFDLPLWLKDRFLFSPSNIGPAFYRNQAVTFHDASVFAVPDAYSQAFKIKYRFIFRRLIKHARCILTDSVFSQHELAHHLGCDPHRLNVILLGGDHLQRVQADETILDKNNLRSRPFMLMVSSQSSHKNLAGLIDAVKRIDSESMVFAIAGGNFAKIFQGDGAGLFPKNMIQLGYATDAELKSLYEHAAGFILPSLYEGFGLPVLEAMNCGCPVLASRAASLPEVGGDAALYFDPFSVDDIAENIQHFILSTQIQSDLRQRGIRQAARFKWRDTAQQTLDLLLL